MSEFDVDHLDPWEWACAEGLAAWEAANRDGLSFDKREGYETGFEAGYRAAEAREGEKNYVNHAGERVTYREAVAEVLRAEMARHRQAVQDIMLVPIPESPAQVKEADRG